MTALQVSTVFACVSLIAGAVAALDLHIFERTIDDAGRAARKISYDHDLYDVLEHQPNPEMTSVTFRKTLQCHALLWGNLYAEIQRDKGGRVVYIWPRNPNRCRPRRLTQPRLVGDEKLAAGEVVYTTTEGMDDVQLDPDHEVPNEGPERVINPKDMIHIPGLAIDGRLGQSVIQLARNAIGLALATEKFGGKFFGNGAVGFGVLEYPGQMTPEAREKFKQSFSEAWGGENAHRPLVLEKGMKYTPTSTKPNEGQFIESRRYQKEEVCSLFGVAPHMIGETEKTNRANTEQLGTEFVTFTMRPWLRAWEQELKRKVLPTPAIGRSASRYFLASFDTRPLTMPDAESRRAFYSSGKQWGYLNTNMILAMEGLNPVEEPWADTFWIPINMQNAAQAYNEPAQGPGPADPNAAGQDDKVGDRFVRIFSRLFRDAFGRVLTRGKADPVVFRRAFLPVFCSIGEELTGLAGEQLVPRCSVCQGRGKDPADRRVKCRECRGSGLQEFEREGLEESRFLADYIAGMTSRFPEWQSANGNTEQVCEHELRRAVRAIAIEVYRSMATARAKRLTEGEP